MSSVEARLKELKASFADKTPKQMRTLRNNLNNRIKSFEEELRFGKALPKLTASHMFYEFELKELKELLELSMKRIRTDEKTK
jgi:tRNA(Ile)-lysidine synthase TilS/MesJ